MGLAAGGNVSVLCMVLVVRIKNTLKYPKFTTPLQKTALITKIIATFSVSRTFCLSKRLLKHPFQEKKLHLCWELQPKKKPLNQNTIPHQPIWHPYFHGYTWKKTTTSHRASCYLLCYGWCENLNKQNQEISEIRHLSAFL